MDINKSYRICSKTVMDTTDLEITFDEMGICNHVSNYEAKSYIRLIDPEKREQEMQILVQRIKKAGKRNDYDCIIGVSGGTDSTYVAYKVKELGLRPLAVHLDNGWNSELAVDNIQKTLSKLEVDLYTHVIDWEEFRDIQLSFLKASTPDLEIPTDHAINALLFHSANKFGVRYIISGSNFNDEGIFPESWAYGHLDWKYISSIHKQYGKKPVKTFPHINLSQLVYYIAIKRIHTVALLNYMHFEKQEAREFLKNELGWRDYGGKHNESLYTKFIQEFILPNKFNIDVRKAYMSAPILRGQISREDALKELTRPMASEESLKNQKEYFLKKMELTEQQFDEIMKLPVKTRHDYPSNINIVSGLRRLLNTARKIGIAST